jgi:hypothetical protein
LLLPLSFFHHHRPEHPDGIYIELIDLHTDYFNPKSEPKMSKDTLLNNLPKTVIKNGQLINMRESVGELLSSKAPVVVSALIDNEEAGITDAEPPCKISVKWSEGNKQGIITVSKFGTVMQLRAKIKSMFYTNSADSEATSALALSDSKEKEVTIELRTTFPSQILEDGTTLEAAGLWPKGQVHARLIR